MTPPFLITLMHYAPLSRLKLGPEDTEALAFATALRAATIERRLHTVWTHPANELAHTKGRTRLAAVAIARALGLITGTADYLFLWNDGSMAIEFKSKTGRLTDNQAAFRDWCALLGVPYHVVRSADAGLDHLRNAGVLT